MYKWPALPSRMASKITRSVLLMCALAVWGLVVPVASEAANSTAQSASTSDFLDPDDAFKSNASVSEDGRSILIKWEIAPGYHLYGGRLSVAASTNDVEFGKPERPTGQVSFDRILGETVESLEGRFEMKVPIHKAPTRFDMEINSQGCADAGLCYPPQSRKVAIELTSAIASPEVAVASSAAASKSPAVGSVSDMTSAAIDDDSGVARALGSGSLLQIVPLFFVLGLLLSFTPCVLPMVPILSSIIVGQGGKVTRSRGLALSGAYSLGMALIYTAMGIGAGLAGEGIAAALQHPVVLATFALILAGLALSMFDAFPLQMPSSIQTRLMSASDRLGGGKIASVFGMGAMSALIVGPCVAAPLAGALMYIGRTHDVVLGGAALFAMATGMSVPLLLTGLSAGSLLPRAGAWMVTVKSFFGVLLLAVALWMVVPILPSWLNMLAWAILAIGCATWLSAFDPLPANARGIHKLGKGIGMVAFLLGALQLAGIALGSDDPLRPLAPLVTNASAGRSAAAAGQDVPTFRAVATSADLDEMISKSTRPVLVDFYADWCVACKEMERFTFTDGAVKERLNSFELLRADVTRNDEASRALMKRFGLFGPPGLVFLRPGSGEITGSRVIGFKKAPEMIAHLERIARVQ